MEQYNIKSKTNYRHWREKTHSYRKIKQTDEVMMIISLTHIEVIIEKCKV
jgi:hypothetical protein